MSTISEACKGAIRGAVIGGLAIVAAGGIPGALGYVALRAAKYAAEDSTNKSPEENPKENSQEHQLAKTESKEPDVGQTLDTTV